MKRSIGSNLIVTAGIEGHIKLQKIKPLCLLALAALFHASPAQAQANFEINFAKSVLAEAQALTLQRGREYCGYIGVDENGRLAASKPRRGRKSACRPKNPPRDWQDIVASYHTHGTYTEDADSEVPSSDDIRADANEGIDGYLVTPGGRMWYIDGLEFTARQICGKGCFPSDPDFVAEDFGPVKSVYTIHELEIREEE